MVQVSGVSDSGQELPSFRMFDLDECGDVCINSDAEPFEVWSNITQSGLDILL